MEKLDSENGVKSDFSVQPLKRIYLWLGDKIFTTIVVAFRHYHNSHNARDGACSLLGGEFSTQ
ncbi:MAG: hypothetical protein U5K72_15350 [Balneolaceae bacterium]|nr:hypothetical protein [Balneolaceae bacterium]